MEKELRTTKDSSITFRTNRRVKQVLSDIANKEGVTVSEYINRVLLSKLSVGIIQSEVANHSN